MDAIDTIRALVDSNQRTRDAIWAEKPNVGTDGQAYIDAVREDPDWFNRLRHASNRLGAARQQLTDLVNAQLTRPFQMPTDDEIAEIRRQLHAGRRS